MPPGGFSCTQGNPTHPAPKAVCQRDARTSQQMSVSHCDHAVNLTHSFVPLQVCFFILNIGLTNDIVSPQRRVGLLPRPVHSVASASLRIDVREVAHNSTRLQPALLRTRTQFRLIRPANHPGRCVIADFLRILASLA